MRVHLRVIAVLLTLACQSAFASPPSAEAFFARPALDAVRLAPSGEQIGALLGTGSGRRLVVMSADRTRARILDIPGHVRSFRWATDERILVAIGGPGRPAGLAAVNRDGSGFRVLAKPGAHGAAREGAVLVDLLPRQPADVLVADDRRMARAPDVFRIDVFDGERTRVARNPGKVFRWWTDRLGRVRLAMAWTAAEGDLEYSLLHRFGPDTNWRKLHQAPLGGPLLTPLGFDADNRHLFVASSVGRDTTAVRRYDTVAMRLGELVHAPTDADVTAVQVAPGGGVASVSFEAREPGRVFPGGPAPEREAWLDRRFPGLETRIVSRDRGGDRFIVLVFGDREPGRFYLMEGDPRRLELLGSRLPWLAGRLGPRRPVSFIARDGRHLDGYLSLPRAKAGRPPLVVMPHGGPWTRDHWGFDAPSQFFASRGYAVLQVNFRGSRGFGRDHLMAGQGEWDGAILDDLADGARWAVNQGIADSRRIGIVGASFGGYAALMSAIRYPGLYRAAASFAAVTDLPRHLERLRASGDERAWEEWRVMVGDPERAGAALVRASPLNHARALDVPVMLAHGDADGRVDPVQSLAMARALDRADAPHRLLLMDGVGHDLDNPGARATFYASALDFIERALER